MAFTSRTVNTNFKVGQMEEADNKWQPPQGCLGAVGCHIFERDTTLPGNAGIYRIMNTH